MTAVMRLREPTHGHAATVQRFMAITISKVSDPSARFIDWLKTKYQVDVLSEAQYNCQVEDEEGVGLLLAHLRSAACKEGRHFSVYNHSGEPPSTLGIKPEELLF